MFLFLFVGDSFSSDNVDGAAVFLDGFLSRFGECMRIDGQFAGQFALAENLNQIFFLNQTVGNQDFGGDFRDVGLFENILQGADIDGIVLNAVDVFETALRQDSIDRHLAAFETNFAAIAGS